MSVFPDAPSMGTGASPEQGSIILNVRQLLNKSMSSQDLANLFLNLQIIEEEWNFIVNPKFGTKTGFLMADDGVVSFETLASVALSNSYNDLDDLPTIPVNLDDIGSPTTPYNFGNQDLKNLKKIVIGSNTTSDYNLEIKNSAPLEASDFFGTEKGIINIEAGSAYDEDSILSIDFTPELNFGKPVARIASQNTDTGSFVKIGTSSIYADGINNLAATFGDFYTEGTSGIKVNESVLFENNGGTIGNGTNYPDDIVALNTQTVISDSRLKIINDEKNNFNFLEKVDFNFLEKMVECIVSWKWKPKLIKEKRKTTVSKKMEINPVTKLLESKSIFESEIIEPEKIKNHSSNHIGFDLAKFYKFFTEELGLRTKDFGFFRVNPTFKEFETVKKTKEKIEVEKKSFDENGDPILNENGIPKAFMSYKPIELLPLAFIFLNKLNKKSDNQDEKLNQLENKLKELEEKIIILEKKKG